MNSKEWAAGMVAAIIGVANAADAAAQEVQLPTTTATGQRQAQGFRAKQTSTATRTDSDLMEIPFAVSSVNAEFIKTVAAGRGDDLYDWVAGVSRQNSFGGLWDNYAVRGFAGDGNTSGTDYLLNGFSWNRGMSVPRDTASVERMEVLKGPASALYGRGDPGGIISYTTKQPQFKSANTVSVSAGSYGATRETLDSTGPLSDTLAYRLNVMNEDNGSFRDTVSNKRYLVAPGFTWKAGPDTIVHYEMEAARQSAPLDRGVVAVNGELGAIPTSRFLGEPRDGNYEVRNLGHQLTVDHRINADWSVNAGVAQRDTDLYGRSSEAFSLQADGRTLWRRYRNVSFHSNDLQGRLELTGNLQTGPVSHTLVMGTDAYRFNYDQFVQRSTPTAAAPYAVDIFNPVYGQPTPALNTATNALEHDEGQGAYVQDTLALGEHWKVIAGLRWDNYRQSIENRRTGITTSQNQTAASPRLGLVYQWSPALSLYANTAYSFRPNNGIDASGNAFAPEKGHGYEVGVKWAGAKWLATLAAFDVSKRNVLTADPANSGFSRAAGEVRSRGLEFEWNGELGGGFRGIANLAYIDAEVTRDTVLTPGARLVDIPRVSGSALLMYEFAPPVGQKAGVGAGVVYVGSRAGNTANTQDGFQLPAYTTVQLNGYVQIDKHLRASVVLNNLFNRGYYVSSYNSLWVTPGAPRSILGTLSYSF
ncbi:TonB-dependent siderophore receptor [Ralstonia mannitolilytica]|uniref:TonB-dependent siderophore receptor n=1 Tax=Ralstonia mannitolilytica TaxID=105219 RepID=UPI0005D8FF29|nr:TonB-dependent receptor [Ralstonia mannitolilytica]AJW43557.1 membrane protein [Ralstonia mannitolilytica]CAJ0731898.1 Metal-pseudopaline receptor CntO [Ralstonia mannitolilytica]